MLAGGTLTFTITVTNNGDDAAADVVVTDTLPPALTDVTASDGGTVAGGTVTWGSEGSPAARPGNSPFPARHRPQERW